MKREKRITADDDTFMTERWLNSSFCEPFKTAFESSNRLVYSHFACIWNCFLQEGFYFAYGAGCEFQAVQLFIALYTFADCLKILKIEILKIFKTIFCHKILIEMKFLLNVASVYKCFNWDAWFNWMASFKEIWVLKLINWSRVFLPQLRNCVIAPVSICYGNSIQQRVMRKRETSAVSIMR